MFEGHISIGHFAADSIIIMTFEVSFIEIYGPSKQSHFHSLIDRHQADKKFDIKHSVIVDFFSIKSID